MNALPAAGDEMSASLPEIRHALPGFPNPHRYQSLFQNLSLPQFVCSQPSLEPHLP